MIYIIQYKYVCGIWCVCVFSCSVVSDSLWPMDCSPYIYISSGDARDLCSTPESDSRKWQPTLVFLPQKFHGQKSLVSCNPWGRRVEMTEHAHTHSHTHTHIQIWCVCVYILHVCISSAEQGYVMKRHWVFSFVPKCPDLSLSHLYWGGLGHCSWGLCFLPWKDFSTSIPRILRS